MTILAEAIGDFARWLSKEMGNGLSDEENFRAAVGPKTIERRRYYKDKDGRHWRTAEHVGNHIYVYHGTFTNGDILSTPYGPERDKSARLPDEIKGTIVHELGHAWDHNLDLYPSSNIAQATTNDIPPTALADVDDPQEYWAELVKCSVYSSQIEPDRIPSQTLGSEQRAFISLVVEKSNPIVPP